MSSRRWTIGLVLALACGSAYAQPEPRDHRDDHDRDHRRMPPPPPPGAPVAVVMPTAPPPPPQAENPGAKAGFEWVAGRWDWRGNKWEWLPGHWERERAGQHWHPGRWEQKDRGWVYVEGAWGAGEGAPMPPPPPGAPPGATPVAVVNATAPPPPPQAENPGAKAGFEWVPGRWDWRGNKWEWMPGHWERERAGQHWHPGRWEQRGGGWAYIEGNWGGGEAPPPGAMPPPPGMPPGPPPPPREWRLDRPVVSSYWPTRGKAGKRVAIRGRNFPPDIQLIYAGQQITGAKVTPEEIVFEIPNGAPSGEIALRRAHGRDLPVGAFEVVATGDPDADWKKQEEERRKRAEAQWAADQKQWAKDRAAREAAWHQREEEMERTREQRREAREREIRAKWDAAFLADPDTQSELTLHAQRVAELSRAKDIAEVNANTKLGVRIDVAMQRESDRHEQRMAALKAGFSAKGGTQ